MAKPKNGIEARKYRLVVLTTDDEIKAYDEMMTAIGENRSEHIRDKLNAEVAIWKAAQK